MSANVVNLFTGRGPWECSGNQPPEDPIFAAIERYKKTVAELDLEDQDSDDAFQEAEWALLETVPTTALGMRVKIALFMNDTTLDSYLRDTDGNAPLRTFLNALYKSFHIIAGLPEPAII
jgi:hypothetical protein